MGKPEEQTHSAPQIRPEAQAWLLELGVTALKEVAGAFGGGGQVAAPATATRSAKPGSSGGSAPSANATLVIDNFDFGKPDMPASHMKELTELRDRLAQAPGSTALLVGHTDTVGTERNNRKLGLARALVVRTILTANKNISAGQIKLDSKGETQPAAGQPAAKLDPDKGDKNPKNRRVEVFVTWSRSAPGVSTKPGQPTQPQGTPTPAPAPVKAPKAAPTEAPDKDGAKYGLTFEHQWESKEFGNWKLTYVKGSFKAKVKIKGKLVQKGSGRKVTGGYTTNKGEKAMIELAKQKSVELFHGLSIKDITESIEHEFSGKKLEVKIQIKAALETGVSWLSPVLTGSLVLVGLEWEKLKKDPGSAKVIALTFGAGVQAEGKFDLNDDWEVSGAVEVFGEGSASPYWPAIIAKIAEALAEEAAEGAAAAEGGASAAEGGAAGALSFEALIAGGAIALGVSVIAGLLKTLVDGEEIRQLSGLVSRTTAAFRAGFAAGILGEKEPSDPLSKPGYEFGQKSFQQAKKAALAKYPLSDKEIRQAIREKLHQQQIWDQLYWLFHPSAQQAVWDAFGSEHAGWVNRNIDPSTIRWGYVAIYGKNPNENDPNYTKYYLK